MNYNDIPWIGFEPYSLPLGSNADIALYINEL